VSATDRTAYKNKPHGEILVASGAILLALVVLWQTWLIPDSPLYAKVGPTVVPVIAGVGLLAFSGALMWSALTGGWQPQEEREVTPDRTALGWIGAGLVLNVMTIGALGFTVASILLFTCVARAFGSRQTLRDALIGAIFALVAYLGFARTLGINIGSGVIENAIEHLVPALSGG
jgi:putative tricarboxylic transport membrane protein